MATVWRFDDDRDNNPDWWGEVDTSKALEDLVVLTNSDPTLVLIEIGGRLFDFDQATKKLQTMKTP